MLLLFQILKDKFPLVKKFPDKKLSYTPVTVTLFLVGGSTITIGYVVECWIIRQYKHYNLNRNLFS